MKRLFRAFFRSLGSTIFLTLVCGAIVTVALIPAVGRYLAAPMCDGTVESETYQWSDGNESGTNVEYSCVSAAGERTVIDSSQLIIRIGLIYLGFMGVIVWPLLFMISYARGGARLVGDSATYLREVGTPAKAKVLGTKRSRIAYNTTSENDMGAHIELEVHPSDGSSPYIAQTHVTLHVTDFMRITPGMVVGVHVHPKNQNKVAITDWNAGGGTAAQSYTQADPFSSVGNDPAAKMKSLQEMLDAGLITHDEFSRKRQEILNEM